MDNTAILKDGTHITIEAASGENIHLPHIDCMMIQELVPGALDKMHGNIDYGFYKTLSE